MKNITVATKIAVAIMFVAVGALAATLIFTDIAREDLTREALDARFVAASTAKTDELSRYLTSIESGVLQLASSEMTIDATRRFTSTYGELPDFDSLDEDQSGVLLPLYRDEFIPDLEKATGRTVPLRDVMPTTDAALYLQSVYSEKAERDKVDLIEVDDADDGSSWTEVHRELHPSLRESALALGFSDVMIIDPEAGAIVYSVAKKTDFATSLAIDPVAGSAVSSVVDTIIHDPVAGAVTVVDFSRYDPDVAAPVAFIGTPIFDADELVGVLLGKISTREISRIMTEDADWESMRLGDTGEVFVIGSDGQMRSDSRMFVEKPDEYLVTATEAGTLSPDHVSGVESAETTVLFQRMDAETLDAVVQSQGEMIDSKSYLGKAVFTTLQPVSGHAVDWNVIVQVERDEALALSNQAKISSAIAVAIFVLLLTFASVTWAGAFIRPIRVLSLRLQSLVHDDPASQHTADLDRERTSTTREFAGLTATINVMLKRLADRERRAALLAAEKRNVVRRFLPDEIARLVESGDRTVEKAEHATVVSVVIGGIGRLEGHGSTEVARDHVERMVDALDDAARSHGLRRVKVVGDSWIAVCGLDTPRVDHIARSIALAVEIARPSGGLEEDELGIDGSVGVATGPVSAGLAGSGRLIYDAWGPTVTMANLLARTAPSGTVLVSEAVAQQLPPDIAATERSGGNASRAAWSITPQAPDTRGVPA